MIRQNFLSNRDKELFDLAQTFENNLKTNKSIYLDADEWVDLADWYAKIKKQPLAFQAIEMGLKEHPDDIALISEWAYLLIDNDLMEKAKEVVDSIKETYLPEAKILKAYFYLQEDKLTEADELLASIEDKDDVANICEVAYCYMDNRHAEKAWPWLERGLKKYAENETFLSALGEYYQEMEEDEKSLEVYNKLVDINPYSALYWFGVARSHYQLKNYNKCIEATDFAIITDNEFGEAYALRGKSYIELGNLERGIEEFETAVKYSADSPADYLNTIAIKYFQEEKWDKATEIWEEMLTKHNLPTPVENIYSAMAYCQFCNENLDKAYEYCQLALKENEESIEGLITKGRILATWGRIEEAEKEWDKVLELDGDNCFTLLWLGEISFYSYDIAYSKKVLLLLWDIDPNYPQLNERLSMVYFAEKNVEKFVFHNQRSSNPIDIATITEEMAKLNQSNDIYSEGTNPASDKENETLHK